MIVRIVKMTFREDAISSFQEIFKNSKEMIRSFEGCHFLELYQDKANPTIFFTYSYWESEKNLDSYRKSELFNKVWSTTKILFSAKPEAWSVDKIVSLK